MNKLSKNISEILKKGRNLTTKELIFIFMIFTICVQVAVIIYSNLVEIRYHIGYDASSAFLHSVEIWRSKSLTPSTYAVTTTLGFDSPDIIAALLYGLIGDIFTAFGLANIILDIFLCIAFYLLLREFNLSKIQTALGFVFFLCPFMTPDTYTANNLSYFAMVFGEQGSYSVKILAMLLIVIVIMRLEHGKKCTAVLIASLFVNALTSFSSGIYVAVTILVPCLFYYVLKIIYNNTFRELKSFGFIYVIAQLFLSFASKTLSSHIFSFEAKEGELFLTGVDDFWVSIGSVIMGYFRLLCGISLETSVGVFSLRGILQVLSVCFILIMAVLTCISANHLIKQIKSRNIDFSKIIPFVVIFTNICIFAFTYTLYDGMLFEYRYLIIVYLMQIIICCMATDKLSEKSILKSMVLFGVTFILLIETVGIFRYYHMGRIENYDDIVAMQEKIDSMDAQIAYSWGSSSDSLFIDSRNFRIMDLDAVYICMMDGTYNKHGEWGDYLYYVENGEWDGCTALITTESDFLTLPKFLADQYVYVDTYGAYQLYVSDVNPFDLSAFKNSCDTNINYMYSDGVDILDGKLDADGNLTTEATTSGNIMNMTLPAVDTGNYSVTLKYDVHESGASSNLYVRILNADTGDLLATGDLPSTQTSVTIDGIAVDETSNIIIKCYQSSGVSVTLKKVVVEKSK
jgi:hypothetical protein